MAANIPFPHGQLLDQNGNLSTEWLLFLQNPTFQSFASQNGITIASGGTGTSVAPTNGQLLIGNAGGTYTVANLVGVGITVTNGSGSITLSQGASGVTPGTYGSAGAVGTFTINSYGQITAASNVSLATMALQNASSVAITGGSVSGVSLAVAGPLSDSAVNLQVPTTGFSITLANNNQTLVLDPAGTLATGTITMCASPVDGQIVSIASSQTITALTISPNAGQSIKNAPTTFVTSLTGVQGYRFIYHLANTTWYRLQ